MLGIFANSRKRALPAVEYIAVASNTSGSTSSSSRAFAVPTHIDGDLLIATIGNTASTVNTPAGWTAIAGSRARAFKRIASSEPANYTFTSGFSGRWAGAIHSFRNSSLIDTASTVISDTSGGGWMTCPAITVDYDDSFVVRLCVANCGASLVSLNYPIANTTSYFFKTIGGTGQYGGYRFTNLQPVGLIANHNTGFNSTTVLSYGISVQINPNGSR